MYTGIFLFVSICSKGWRRGMPRVGYERCVLDSGLSASECLAQNVRNSQLRVVPFLMTVFFGTPNRLFEVSSALSGSIEPITFVSESIQARKQRGRHRGPRQLEERAGRLDLPDGKMAGTVDEIAALLGSRSSSVGSGEDKKSWRAAQLAKVLAAIREETADGLAGVVEKLADGARDGEIELDFIFCRVLGC